MYSMQMVCKYMQIRHVIMPAAFLSYVVNCRNLRRIAQSAVCAEQNQTDTKQMEQYHLREKLWMNGRQSRSLMETLAYVHSIFT